MILVLQGDFKNGMVHSQVAEVPLSDPVMPHNTELG